MSHSIFLMNPIGSVEKTWGRFLNEAYLRRTYLQGRTHVLARTDARTCGDGCTYLRGQMLNEGFSRKRLREWLQCFAGAVANVCGNGCNALRLRGAKLELKSSVLFWMREKAAP